MYYKDQLYYEWSGNEPWRIIPSTKESNKYSLKYLIKVNKECNDSN